MKRQSLLRPLAGGALMLMLALPVVAQPRGPRPGGFGPGGFGPEHGDPGGFGPRPQMELNRVWHDLADLEGGNLALSKAQSAKVVALVVPVSKQSALGDAEAQRLADNIEAVLTPAQRAAIDKDHPRGPHGDGPHGGPHPGDGNGGRRARPDGPSPRDGEGRGARRGPDGNGPRGDGPPRMNREDFEKVRPFMDALNPFYPPTGYAGFKGLAAEFATDTARRYGERRALLESLSKRAKAR